MKTILSGSLVLGARRFASKTFQLGSSNNFPPSKLPEYQIPAYQEHLKWLAPNSGIDDILDISSRNLHNLNQVLSSQKGQEWQAEEIKSFLTRFEQLQFFLTHSTSDPDKVKSNNALYSRDELSKRGVEVEGLMKKTGDREHHYSDFIFFGLKACSNGETPTPSYSRFIFPFTEEIQKGTCMFIQDHYAIGGVHFLGEETICPGEPLKTQFNGFDRYTETDHGKFRYKFCDKSGKEVALTDFITGRQQFFYGEDIKSAILSMALFHAPFAGGKEFLLNCSDQELASYITNLSDFEIRVANRLSIDDAIYQSKSQPKKSLQPKSQTALKDSDYLSSSL